MESSDTIKQGKKEDTVVASQGTKEEVEELKQALGEQAEDIVASAQTGSETKGKMSADAKKLYVLIKTMTALRLKRDDSQPAEVVDRLFLGSVGAAFNKESLDKNGITHILTCADKIHPRFP
jgi:hypothetical protein